MSHGAEVADIGGGTGDLLGRQVLLIAPLFFGYDKEIAEGLRRRGAQVDVLPDRPFVSPVMKALTRVRREWVLPWTDRFFLESVAAFGRSRYDLVFVVIGEGVSTRVLKEYRASFPGAVFVLYMWDSISSKNITANLSSFDHLHTFDPEDAKTYAMNYRPLFYSPGFSGQAVREPRYQLSFVGTAHSDRYALISRLKDSLPPGISCYWYLYLHAHWVYAVYRLANPVFAGAPMSSFQFKPLPAAAVQAIFFESLAVLDIQHPNQSGLTMRTFEALGARKKIVTTNARIREADFYTPDNILVIGRKETAPIPASFFETPYQALPDAMYRKYSLAGWLDDVAPASLWSDTSAAGGADAVVRN